MGTLFSLSNQHLPQWMTMESLKHPDTNSTLQAADLHNLQSCLRAQGSWEKFKTTDPQPHGAGTPRSVWPGGWGGASLYSEVRCGLAHGPGGHTGHRDTGNLSHKCSLHILGQAFPHV